MTLLGLIVLGLGAGAVAASLGIGGGVIYVPALVTLFDLTQQTGQGTSLAIVVPTALVATIANARRGRVEWRTAGLVAIGAVVGAFAGSRLALSLDETVLKRLFAGLLVVVALRMLRRTRRIATEGRDETATG
ncbi:MAG: sulfite exporter TauE/SafE family protein [Acidimicrobiia bacterium]|nr:sulfite exporter TauE/SafE family protein [Acidimicrobiia bacterium]MDH3470615.1 sulfite exporter TauE/SafE family protein [Acidimicrobiia bacterium]